MFSLADTIEAAFPYTLPVWLTSYHQGVTPLSTWGPVATAIVVYLSTIFGIQELMRGRDPWKLTFLFQVSPHCNAGEKRVLEFSATASPQSPIPHFLCPPRVIIADMSFLRLGLSFARIERV